MALRHFANDLGYSVRQTEMNCDGGYDHCQHCYPYAHHAVVTVIAIGVSLTNVRPALWHAAAAMVAHEEYKAAVNRLLDGKFK